MEALVRTRMWLGIIALLAARTACAADGPITSNPIPEPIVKRGIAVEVKDVARLPDTRALRPADQDVSPAAWARVSYVRDLPDGRRFVSGSHDKTARVWDFKTGNESKRYTHPIDVNGLAIARDAPIRVAGRGLPRRLPPRVSAGPLPSRREPPRD